MNLSECLAPERVIILESSTKNGALAELVDRIARAGSVPPAAEIEEAIQRRERLMSTGIGLGIAVPHVRLDGVARPIASLGTQPHGVADYGSLDDAPVTIIVMIVAGTGQHADYIRLLAQVTERLKDKGARRAMLDATSPEEIFRTMVKG
jgi:PTS system nitrogen regulatory IIA component